MARWCRWRVEVTTKERRDPGKLSRVERKDGRRSPCHCCCCCHRCRYRSPYRSCRRAGDRGGGGNDYSDMCCDSLIQDEERWKWRWKTQKKMKHLISPAVTLIGPVSNIHVMEALPSHSSRPSFSSSVDSILEIHNKLASSHLHSTAISSIMYSKHLQHIDPSFHLLSSGRYEYSSSEPSSALRSYSRSRSAGAGTATFLAPLNRGSHESSTNSLVPLTAFPSRWGASTCRQRAAKVTPNLFGAEGNDLRRISTGLRRL